MSDIAQMISREVERATTPTWSGRRFDYTSPMANMICLQDIAVSLSRMPRFAGHTREPYSVLQHSIHVHNLMEMDGCSIRKRAIGLMHDAPEAYTMDIPLPFKKMLPMVSIIEESIRLPIWEATMQTVVPCGDDYVKMTEIHDELKRYDHIALVTEARDLFDNLPLDEWVEAYGVEPHPERIEVQSPQHNLQEFALIACVLELKSPPWLPMP